MAENLREIDICIVILVGLPGSGKTSLCQALSNCVKLSSNSLDCYHLIPICYDALIPADTIKWKDDNADWKNARKNVLRHVAKLIRCLIGLDGNEVLQSPDREIVLDVTNCPNLCRIFIVIDDNMYYRSMRYEYYQLARLYNLKFCQLYVDCLVNNALYQNSSRKSKVIVPEEVIHRMAEKLEPPDPGLSWERSSLTVPSDRWTNETLDKILQFLKRVPTCPSLIHNKQMHIQAQEICSTNIVHQLDLALRKLIGEKLKSSKNMGLMSKELENQSMVLADMRRRIMEGIKAGRIEIPQHVQEAIEQNHPEKACKLKDLLDGFLMLH